MSINLFDDDGSMMGQIDDNTHQVFDSNHNHIATVDHLHHNLNDVYGQTLIHHDTNSGSLFDGNHNMIGSVQHQPGMPEGTTTISDLSGQSKIHISNSGDVTDANGQHIGTIKNEW